MKRKKIEILKSFADPNIWTYKKVIGGTIILMDNQDNSFELEELFVHRPRTRSIHISLGIRQIVKSIDFIYQSIFQDNDKVVLKYSSSLVVIPINTIYQSIDDLLSEDFDFKLALPIWEKQYNNEVVQMMERFKDIEEIYKYDNATKREKRFISGNNMAKRLILHKLISEDLFQSYCSEIKRSFTHLLNDPKWANDAETHKGIREIKKLILYLYNLDAGKYLKAKPWRKKEGIARSLLNPIVLSRTSVLVLSTMVSVDNVRKYFGINRLSKFSAISVNESSRMTMKNDQCIDILYWKENTIIFVQDPITYDSFDISLGSEGKSVLRFSVDDVSNSYQYELFENGKMKIKVVDLNGDVTRDERGEKIDANSEDPEEMIRALFKIVTNRDLNELSAEEVISRYKFSR